MPMTLREVRLKSRPAGQPAPENFELAEAELPPLGDGEVRVRNLFLSVDPYMRGRMTEGPSYVAPFALGAPLEGGAVGEVTESRADGLKAGDHVFSMLGWRTHAQASAAHFQKLPAIPGVSPSAFLGVLGMPGMTAWVGLNVIGGLKPDDIVLVSGAGGAVGSLAVQLAKLKGATVIGLAGSDAKCAWVRALGADAAINYRAGDVGAALKEAAPKGITLYFDNVGGEQLEAAMRAARPFARLVECGMIARYNETNQVAGPSTMLLMIVKRLRMEGFIVSDHDQRRGEFLAEVGPLVASGQVRAGETVVDGIETMVDAFLGLFRGANTGKMLVRP